MNKDDDRYDAADDDAVGFHPADNGADKLLISLVPIGAKGSLAAVDGEATDHRLDGGAHRGGYGEVGKCGRSGDVRAKVAGCRVEQAQLDVVGRPLVRDEAGGGVG